MATTFTRKAANELNQRIRIALIESGRLSDAEELILSAVGTVNSICGKILSNTAIEQGLSPSLRVVSERDQGEMFSRAVDHVIAAHSLRLAAPIVRMQLQKSWRTDLRRLVDLSREYGLDNVIAEFYDASLSSLKLALPAVSLRYDEFQEKLRNELTSSVEIFRSSAGSNRLDFCKKIVLNAVNQWRSEGYLAWSEVHKISRLRAEKETFFLQKLVQLASSHQEVDLFHEDLKAIVRGTFQCASECVSVYELFKRERGLLDFVDQERLVLNLLHQAGSSASNVIHDFQALLVDEFQDTSPLQLEIFLELTKFVGKAVWVGDFKQSIYGFRGADSNGIRSVLSQIEEDGATTERLQTSFRSRKELVDFTNQVFAHSMASSGLSQGDVCIDSVKREEVELNGDPVRVWWLSGKTENERIAALTIGVKQIIDEDSPNFKGTDIAILCRTNSTRLKIAEQLSRRGILVATQRPGLLREPEIILSLAALRYLVDPYDTLAMAEIDYFSDNQVSRDTILLRWLLAHERSKSMDIEWLDALRSSTSSLTPLEILQFVVTSPFVLKNISEWQNPQQRTLNLDALLGLARTFEDSCRVSGQTANIQGLLTYIVQHSEIEQPAVQGDNAVAVVTYHKAKGLEWRCVILYDLEFSPNVTPFGVSVTGDFRTARGLNYWPNPYGFVRSSELPKTSCSRHNS